MKRAIYAGSFDIFHKGHLWMVEQGSLLFDDLLVVIADNPNKNYYFSYEERINLVKNCCSHLKNVKYTFIENELLVDVAKELNYNYFLRGIRNNKDFEYEKEIMLINGDICPEIQTIFLIPPEEVSHISSSMIKGIIGLNGWEKIIEKYVPNLVLNAIKGKIKC